MKLRIFKNGINVTEATFCTQHLLCGKCAILLHTEKIVSVRTFGSFHNIMKSSSYRLVWEDAIIKEGLNRIQILCRRIQNGDKQPLQDDIDKLIKWSEKWQMLFNFQKCKCLHAGHGNTGVNYEMGGTIICKTVKEKDLGVTMNASMKVSEQCRIAASKGNQILGMIRRNITYKEKGLIVPLYKAIVRPHLEYCIQAWRPYLRKDIDMLDKVQRRTTKLITGLRDLSYDDRLKECGLTTLETRRLRGDQIEVFKILNGHANIDPNIFFKIKTGKITRGHDFTLVKGQNMLDFRKYSFSKRKVNEWNKLSADCVYSSSVNMFKNRIDNYLVRAGYT